jgi:hypothetical protein
MVVATSPSQGATTHQQKEFPMLRFLASTVGIIFLIGLAVVVGLLMLIF